MLIDWAKWARNKSDPYSHIPESDTGREYATCGHGNTDIHGRCAGCRADASVNPDAVCPVHADACPAKKGREQT